MRNLVTRPPDSPFQKVLKLASLTLSAIVIAVAFQLCFVSTARADESARLQKRASTAECHNSDVVNRIAAIQQEIQDLEYRAQKITRRDMVEDSERQNYDDPYGRIPGLARELQKTREMIETLRGELARLNNLPKCLKGSNLQPIDDECFSDDARDVRDLLKEWLADAQAQLATDQLAQSKAIGDLTKASSAAGRDDAQNRLGAASASVAYDLRVIQGLNAQIALIEALPPCVDHNVVPPSDGTNTSPVPPPPANPPPPVEPPTKPMSAICQHCEWLKTQIQDIDDQIAGWQRQDASIRKYSNLSDPKIQNALKDIADKIADLRNKQARLRAELPDCEKKCLPPAETLVPPPTPPIETPPPPAPPPKKKKEPVFPIPPPATNGPGDTPPATDGPVCPPPGTTGIEPLGPVVVPGQKTPLFVHERLSEPPPPAPTDSIERGSWEGVLRTIHAAEGEDGDVEDVADAVKELADMIEFEEEELQDDRYNEAAAARLAWLRKQYASFKAWDEYEETLHPRLKAYENCPRTTTPPADKKDDSHNSGIENLLGHVTIGVGVGGGDRHGDSHDHSSGSDKPPSAKPSTDKPPSDEP